MLREHARLPVDVDSVADGADLWAAGMASHASVDVMLALEYSFDIEFPEPMLRRSTFTSIDAMAAAIGTLQGPGEDA